jgi:hypothetical protein
MNLRLARVFMRGVGPASARFDPLTVDFRDQREAAEHSVLWLRNGGGKTTFERLLFHVLAWGDARNIGKEERSRPGGIEYLLGPDDVGHVVLEWIRADAPDARALITGVVCQLKQGTGHLRDEDGNLKRSRGDVERRFYACHALDDFGLDEIAELQLSEGRRLALRAYVKVLENLDSAHPKLRLESTPSVTEWTQMLDDRGLDSELFRYQVNMNQGEGGADQVIARAATNEQFIDFVLQTITPPGDVADVRRQFEKHRDELAQMPQLRRRRSFVATLSQAMSQLASVHDAERVAGEAVQRAETESRRLHGQFLTAAERDERRAVRAAETQTELRRERVAADTTRKRHNEEAAWLEYWATQQRLELVSAELADVVRAQAAAQLDAGAWPLTEAVIGRDSADALAAQLDAALRERDDQAAPLRAERDRYAAALRAAHELAARRHEAAQHDAETEAVTEGAAAARHEETAHEAERAAATAAERMQQAQTQLDAAAQTRAQAITGGVLEREQSAVTARDEAENRAVEQRLRAENYDDQAAAAVADAQVALSARIAAERDAGAAERRQDQARHTLDEHDREHAEVATMPALAELLDSPNTDLHMGASVLASALRERTSSIEADQRDTDGQLRHVRRDLEALADRQLLAPRVEVAQALSALRAEGLDALSGFEYLNDAAPSAGRERLVARHPHIADGVVLTSPDADIEQAMAVLDRGGLAPTFPVAVAPADALLANDGQPEWRVWGGDEALYDQTAAQARRRTLEADAECLATRAEELAGAAEAGRHAASALNALERRWPAARLETLRSDLADAATALDQAQSRASEAQAQVEAAQAAERQAREAAKSARGAAEVQHQRAQALVAAAATEIASADAGESLRLEKDRQTVAQADALSESASAAACRERREAALSAASASAIACDQARTAAAAVVVVNMPPEPELTAQPIAVLSEQLDLAQRRLDAEIRDDALARELDEARKDSARCSKQLNSATPDVRARAQALAAEPAAQTPESRSRHAQAQTDAAERHGRRRSELDTERGSLDGQLRRVATERTQPAQLPSAIEEADRLRAEAIAAAGRQRSLSENLEARMREAASVEREAERDAEVFRSLIDALLEPLAGQAPYPDGAQRAREERDAERTRRERLQTEHRRCQQAVEAGRRAVGAWLRDPAAESAPELVEKLNRSNEDLLASHASQLTDELINQVALIDERLAGIDNDRELIIKFLEPRVSEAIARLRALQRTSRLPSTLGAWADREFLSIRFDPPGDTARRLGLVGKALDELLQSQSSPDGFRLLLHATLTVLGRVRVSVLKPEPGMPSAQMTPVSGLSDFSGGERATVAILLYCALSNLRRGALARSDRIAAVSTLLLDNPFGKASSGFLVDQQIQVASALGMQLIYTTAIQDVNALDRFPVLVRLRNRRDLTRSMRYIRHDGQPAELHSNGGPPTIEAARLVRRDV